MGEEGERLLWCYQMGLLECSEPMHALLKHNFLHVQLHVCDIIMPMEVNKYSKPFKKIFEKLEIGLELRAALVKSPNCMLCMNKHLCCKTFNFEKMCTFIRVCSACRPSSSLPRESPTTTFATITLVFLRQPMKFVVAMTPTKTLLLPSCTSSIATELPLIFLAKQQ
jgi:hypothetical protein